MDQKLREIIAYWLTHFGVETKPEQLLPTLILLLLCLLIATIAYIVVRRGIVRALNLLIQKAKRTWAKSLMHFQVLEKIALLIPAFILELLIPSILAAHPAFATLSDRLLSLWIVILVIRVAYGALDAANEIADINLVSRRMPIKSFVQLLKLFLLFIGVIVSMSILADQSPIYFLSGLGVATGLVMLVFRDTILGFVAGIQLAANRMVSRGDWIQMDKYGANGAIEEISLTTIKVRNWDNTLTMLPAYALVQESFINWRGMSESGGRRIKRSINLDVSTIRFLSAEDMTRLQQIKLLQGYLAEKQQEQAAYNEARDVAGHPVNGRYLTNLGTFRAYLQAYLQQSEHIRQDMTLLVRQLDPEPTGLPLQIYVFTSDTRWDVHENIQADIFEHVYAILPEFDLRPFQVPSGEDMQRIGVKQV